MTTSTTTSAPPTINSLSLLALKCGSNVFDLSSDMSNISIRDQVVRGRLLARDLACLPQPPSLVLVVGAGFGGISAALACAEANMAVMVVERNDEPFKLQARANDRYVGPLMYEWPMHESQDQTYPPVTSSALGDKSILQEVWATLSPGKDPLPAQQLAKLSQTALGSLLAGKPIDLYTQVDATDISAFVHAYHLGTAGNLQLHSARKWPSGSSANGTTLARPDAIILSGGMGDESISLKVPPELLGSVPAPTVAAGTRFWDIDNWMKASSSDDVGVFGAGDGALQDVLRALTGLEHPLTTLNQIRKHSGVDAAIAIFEAELLACEMEGRLAAIWTQVREVAPSPPAPVKNHRNLIDEWVDKRCVQIAQKLAGNASVVAEVGKVLRAGNGTVHHVFRETHFTKTYLLNRFMVHLINECQSAMGGHFASKVRYRKSDSIPEIFGTCTTAFGRQFRVWLRSSPTATQSLGILDLDRIAVRFGAIGSSLPGRQMVGLSRKEIAERTVIGQVPCPIVAHPMNW